MRFTVPQFIEMEPKIVGPLTFKQFIFIGIAGAICFILYFSLGKTNFFLFLIVSIFVFGISFTLAFLKIGGRGLPVILANFFRFSLMPKIYIWRKTEKPITIFKKELPEEKEIPEEELPLKIAEKSQLKKIRIQIETKTR